MFMAISSACKQDPVQFAWTDLPKIPDHVGFAGSFAGVSNNTLIVAGGANFPDGGAPWTGSKKVWHNQVFVLESRDGVWKSIGHLPRALGYGVSISTDKGLIMIGGSNEQGHYNDVYMLKYTDDSITYDILPSLPGPLANSAGVVMDNVIYVMGGTMAPASTEAENNFWSLDLNDLDADWNVLESWPGPSRMLSVAGTDGRSVYLFSGAHLEEGVREYLTDSYKFSIEEGWERLADLPRAVVAAPTPAYTDKNNNLFILGGDDGSLADIDPQKDEHPGFSKSVLRYSVQSDEWTDVAVQPGKAAVTTPLVIWNNEVVIPGGEIKPAVRTTQVRSLVVK